MNYYGQNKEDMIIVDYLVENNLSGWLMDIGAYDGITFSNSRTLIENGWEGILIEADFGNAEKCRVNYIGFNAKVLCSAIHHSQSGIIEFSSSNGDMVGSTETAHVKKWSKDVKFNKCLVNAISPVELFNTFGDVFTFINVDVEGISSEIGSSIIKLFHNCKIICIEHDNNQDYLQRLGAQYGYNQTLLINAENIILAK